MRHLLLFIFSIFLTVAVSAQPPADKGAGQKEEKIRALYVAYLTKSMSLTGEEAERFWPVHAQYESELRAVNMNNTDELSRQQQVLNIKKKYQPSFQRVVGADRSNQFFRQDAEFRKKMVERIKQMRQQRQQGGAGMQRGGKGRR